jgi:hypothetical protein
MVGWPAAQTITTALSKALNITLLHPSTQAMVANNKPADRSPMRMNRVKWKGWGWGVTGGNCVPLAAPVCPVRLLARLAVERKKSVVMLVAVVGRVVRADIRSPDCSDRGKVTAAPPELAGRTTLVLINHHQGPSHGLVLRLGRTDDEWQVTVINHSALSGHLWWGGWAPRRWRWR